MQYQGPESVDFADVHALNRVFLKLVHGDRNAGQFLDGLHTKLVDRLRTLTSGQLARLASAPFLLFSFRERDRRFWDEICTGEACADLFADNRSGAEPGRLIAAGLGFVWRLSRQNPYALRLVSGASLHWCERVAEQALVDILERAASRPDLLTLRAAQDRNVWHKLLYGGVDHRQSVRAAAQLCALQTLLTHPNREPAIPWATAACRSHQPSLSVAEESGD